MGILRERFNRYKEIIFEGFKQSLEAESQVKEYFEISKKPILEASAEKLATSLFFVKISMLLIGSLAGLYKMIFKNKSKSLVSRVVKTTMLLATLSITIVAAALVVSIGLKSAAYLLLGGVAVNVFRKAYGYMRSRNKLKSLIKLQKRINQRLPTEMTDKVLKKLMKSDDVSDEYLAKNIDVRINKMRAKVNKRKSLFKCSGVDFAISLTIAMTALIPVVGVFIAVGLGGIALLFGLNNVRKKAIEIHRKKIDTELGKNNHPLEDNHDSLIEERNRSIVRENKDVCQNEHIHLFKVHDESEELESKLEHQESFKVSNIHKLHERDQVMGKESLAVQKMKLKQQASNEDDYEDNESPKERY